MLRRPALRWAAMRLGVEHGATGGERCLHRRDLHGGPPAPGLTCEQPLRPHSPQAVTTCSPSTSRQAPRRRSVRAACPWALGSSGSSSTRPAPSTAWRRTGPPASWSPSTRPPVRPPSSGRWESAGTTPGSPSRLTVGSGCRSGIHRSGARRTRRGPGHRQLLTGGSLAKGVYGSVKTTAEKIPDAQGALGCHEPGGDHLQARQARVGGVTFTSDDPPAESLQSEMAALAELAAKQLDAP